MAELEGKKLLVLGGMRISCEIIKKAKEMGIYVVVTDYYEPKDSPGKQIADRSFMVSTTDVDAVVNLIQKEKIDGVIVGFNDMLLPYYADICQKVELPCYGTREQFEIFLDKEKYKKACNKFSVPTIQTYSLADFKDDQKRKEIRFPVIVKPSDNSGSRGITICDRYDDLEEAYKKAVNFSKTKDVIIEQYLAEKEATVFWIFMNGEYFVSTIGNRHLTFNQKGLVPAVVGYSFPSVLTNRYLSDVAPKAKKMFQSLGIRNGMMFMQCKVQDGKCLVYDIGYRLTGSLEYKILKETCGYDPLEQMIRFALTGNMSEQDIKEKINPYLGRYSYNISRQSAPGRIGQIIGREEVRGYPGVLDVVTAHLPGEVITKDMEGLLSQITVRVLGTSNSKTDLYRDIDQIQQKIKILSDTGMDLSLKGIEMSDLDKMLAEVNMKI